MWFVRIYCNKCNEACIIQHVLCHRDHSLPSGGCPPIVESLCKFLDRFISGLHSPDEGTIQYCIEIRIISRVGSRTQFLIYYIHNVHDYLITDFCLNLIYSVHLLGAVPVFLLLHQDGRHTAGVCLLRSLQVTSPALARTRSFGRNKVSKFLGAVDVPDTHSMCN